MHRTLRTAAAAAALIVPIGTGWAYTAGASVSDVASGIADTFDFDTEDQWHIDGWQIDRVELDGVVTMSVVDPSGVAVAVEDLPEDIADEVEFYRSEWTPEGADVFSVNDGVACYQLSEVQEPSGDSTTSQGDNGRTRLMKVSVNEDGDVSVNAAEFSSDDYDSVDGTDSERRFHEGLIEISDIPGGTPILPCD